MNQAIARFKRYLKRRVVNLQGMGHKLLFKQALIKW